MSSREEEEYSDVDFETEQVETFEHENMTLQDRMLLLQNKELKMSFQSRPSDRKHVRNTESGVIAVTIISIQI